MRKLAYYNNKINLNGL